MGLVCIQNSSLLVYSKSQKVSASYCLPFRHSRGKNQPVGGFRPPPPACLGLNIVALYLAGGSDFTDKWYNKTHETFLVQLMKHTEYIEDLVICDDTYLPYLNKESYRRLIHTVWCSKSVCHPSKKSYDE